MSLETIDTHTHIALQRSLRAQVHFSDVLSENSGPEDQFWWRHNDFDASLTIKAESGELTGLTEVPIGERPWLTPYGLVVLDDLVRARKARVGRYSNIPTDALHLDRARERHESKSALAVVANEARRDDAFVADGHNGEDFYLALTYSGLEVYTTPLSFLSGLAARSRIQALYRIPTKGHPEFDGDHEQFRSARIVRSRRHPGHLVPVFAYHNPAEQIAAQAEDSHPAIIPIDNRPGHIAYVDKFGNVRGELQDIRSLSRLATGSTVGLAITNNGQEYEFGVTVAQDLRSAPLDQLVVYTNCSDQVDQASTVGFFELIARVNGSPSTSKQTAVYQLLAKIPDLDFATATLSLTK